MKKRIQVPLALGEDTATVVDELVNDYLPHHCMGINDLAVVSGLMTTATILIAAHCQRVGSDDFDELLNMARDIFDISAKVMRDKRKG